MKRLFCGLMALACSGAFADYVYRTEPMTAYWTGAKSGEWIDRENWVVKDAGGNETVAPCPPGVVPACQDVYGNLGCKNDTAVFDRGSSNTKIVFPAWSDGVKTAWQNGFSSISNVIIRGASTPAYQFGSPADAVLPLCHHGTLKIEADVTTTQVLRSLSVGTFGLEHDRGIVIENNSSKATLRVTYWLGYCSNDPEGPIAAETSCSGESHIYVKGCGNLQLDSTGNGARANMVFRLQQTDKGKILIGSDSPGGFPFYRIEVDRPDLSEQIIETMDSSRNFSFSTQNVTQFQLGENQKCRVKGPGTHRFIGSSSGNGIQDIGAGAVLEIDGQLICCNPSSYSDRFSSQPAHGLAFTKKGAGVIRLNNAANDIRGTIECKGGSVEFAKFGNVGEASPIGTGDGIGSSANEASVVYTGPGESTDKRIYVDSAWVRFVHNGTGDLTFTGTDPLSVAHTTSSPKIILFNPNGNLITFNEPIVESRASQPLWIELRNGDFLFKGGLYNNGHLDIKDGVTATVEGDIVPNIRLTASAAAPSTITIVGGQDAVVERSISMLSNDNYNAVCKLVLKDKVRLTVDSIQYKNPGRIDVVTSDPDSTLVLRGATSATDFGDKLTINGQRAGFDDQGRIRSAGRISGDVDVVATGRAQTSLLAPDNDYTGRTIVCGLLGASIYAAYPGSIPDHAKVDVFGGHVTVPFVSPFETAGWTAQQMLALAGSANFLSNGVVCADTTYSGDRTIELSDALIAGDELRFGHDGTQTLTLTGTTTKKTHLKAYNGTLAIKDANMRLGGVQATWSQHAATDWGAGGKGYGTIVIENSTVALSDTEPVVVGGDDGATYSTEPKKPYTTGSRVTNNGRLVIRDSSVKAPLEDVTSANLVPGGTGGAGAGLIEVEGDSDVEAKICVGSLQYADRAGFYQRGGRVHNRGSNAQRIAYMGSGSYQLDDGFFRASVLEDNVFTIAANQSPLDGLFLQFGGTSEFVGDAYDGVASRYPNSRIYFGSGQPGSRYAGTGNAWIYVGGGTMTFSNLVLRTGSTSGSTAAADDNGGGMASLTVSGEGSEIVFAPGLGLELSYNNRSLTSFNILDDGVFATAVPLAMCDRTAKDRVLYVNFNGGVLKALASCDILGGSGSALRATAAHVFENGATIDTNGKEVGLYAPLAAPTGKGVASVTVKDGAETVIKGNLVASTAVSFEDYVANTPQTICLVDPHQNKITNTVVVCPGWGYDAAPTAYLSYDVNHRLAPDYVEVAMKDLVSGGVTYAGGGTVTLGVANTYGGRTAVKAGTAVLCRADGAIPSGSALTLETGASVDFGDTAQTVGPLTVSGSANVAGSANVTWPTQWTIASDGKGIVFDGPVVFAPGTTVEIANPAEADALKRCTFITLKGGYSGPLPTFTGVPEGRTVQLSGNRLKLNSKEGLFMVVR